MGNLSDLNDLYNVQEVILLMVIIENRFQEVQNGTGYNPRKISSASKLSRCIQREQSECVLALPTNNCHVEIFEKTLSGGFSCVNTRLSFDTELLMPNLIEKDFNKRNIDQSFKAFERDDLKLVYKVHLMCNINHPKFPCRICAKNVHGKDKAVQCDLCELWIHIKCNKLNYLDYRYLQNCDEPGIV